MASEHTVAQREEGKEERASEHSCQAGMADRGKEVGQGATPSQQPPFGREDLHRLRAARWRTRWAWQGRCLLGGKKQQATLPVLLAQPGHAPPAELAVAIEEDHRLVSHDLSIAGSCQLVERARQRRSPLLLCPLVTLRRGEEVPMLVELVLLLTADGVQLPAAFFPAAQPRTDTAVDAVVLNPGTSGNFWHPTLTAVATVLAQRGYPALTLSTRGHDYVFRDVRNNRYLGASYECIADCPYDFTAAIRWLVERGYSRIALYGHSLGATKATYYAAHDPDPHLVAVIAFAGPRWSGSLYASGPAAELFHATRARAEALVAAGRGEELMEVTFPIPLLITAAGWLDKYAGERYNVATWGDRIRVPILRLDSALDEGLAALHQAGIFDDLQRLAPNPNHRHVILTDVDHFMTRPGSAEAVGQAVVSWLDDLARPRA